MDNLTFEEFARTPVPELMKQNFANFANCSAMEFDGKDMEKMVEDMKKNVLDDAGFQKAIEDLKKNMLDNVDSSQMRIQDTPMKKVKA